MNRGRFATRVAIFCRWSGMVERCHDPESKFYRVYGGRGIRVCPEWERDFVAFETWALANGYRQGLEIDRIDNDRGYSPDNCQWITHRENLAKMDRAVTLPDGSLAIDRARANGMNDSTFYSRRARGMSPADAADPSVIEQY